MPERTTPALVRLVERVATLSPPRHRELARGMVGELEAIGDPAERVRFALGALAAIARLALREHARTTGLALARFVGIRELRAGIHPGGFVMSTLTTGRLLRRHVTPFIMALTLLTLLLLAPTGTRQVMQLSARGVPPGEILEVLLLALPYTLALTIPMAVFLAVTWVFTRLGAHGALGPATRGRRGVRRLLTPVLGAALVITSLAFVLNTQVLPRANTRLAAVREGAPMQPNDRTMNVAELRAAAGRARSSTADGAAAHAAAYEVEIQKKYALAAACLLLALAGAAIGIRFPRGGAGLVVGAGAGIFAAYYFLLLAGESLADRQVVSPFIGMWMANGFLLATVLLLAGRPAEADPAAAPGAVPIGG